MKLLGRRWGKNLQRSRRGKGSLLLSDSQFAVSKPPLCRKKTSHRITKEEKSGKNVANQGIGMETAE